MATLKSGQSELDTITLRLPDLGKELKTWDNYQIKSDYLIPTDGFSFTLSTDEPLVYNEILKPGARIEVACNDRMQMTGYIEKVLTAQDSESGLVYQVTGRDILGVVVSASIDRKIKISANQTVADFLQAVLGQFGIDQIYVGQDQNTSIITGYLPGKGKAQTKTNKVQVAKSRQTPVPVKDASGKVIGTQLKAELVYETSTVTQVISNNRPDLKAIPNDQLQPREGEGAMQLLERFLSRLGLQIHAAADGSGVVVDSPDFVTLYPHKLIRKFNGNGINNIVDGDKTINVETQASCIVAKGFGGGNDFAKSQLVSIAVNELIACRPDGSYYAPVQNIISRYPKAKVLPLRSQLLPKYDNEYPAPFQQKPMFVKDDESKNLDQIAAVARRRLSTMQKEFMSVRYTVIGHTYDGYPWAPNTLVNVDDDVLGIHENLWVLDRTFSKSRAGGTLTTLTLIKPYTLELGDK